MTKKATEEAYTRSSLAGLGGGPRMCRMFGEKKDIESITARAASRGDGAFLSTSRAREYAGVVQKYVWKIYFLKKEYKFEFVLRPKSA